MTLRKLFRDDIYNGSGVIVLTDIQTDRQTDEQTDIAENNTTLATLRCAGGNQTTPPESPMRRH